MARKTVNTEINLLPSNLMKNSGFVKFTDSVKSLALVLSVLLVIAIFVVASFIIININRINILEGRRNDLVSQVEALNEQEQLHFIIKDKTSKIVTIKGEHTEVANELAAVNQLYSAFPQLAELDTLGVSRSGTDMSFSTPDSRTLAQSLDYFLEKNFYANVLLSSLSFTPTGGYRVDMAFISNALAL